MGPSIGRTLAKFSPHTQLRQNRASVRHTPSLSPLGNNSSSRRKEEKAENATDWVRNHAGPSPDWFPTTLSQCRLEASANSWHFILSPDCHAAKINLTSSPHGQNHRLVVWGKQSSAKREGPTTLCGKQEIESQKSAFGTSIAGTLKNSPHPQLRQNEARPRPIPPLSKLNNNSTLRKKATRRGRQHYARMGSEAGF